MRLLKILLAIFLALFVLPTAANLALVALDDRATAWQEADPSSVAFLPAAGSHPQARILIMSARLSGHLRGRFFSHSWVVLKGENAPSWDRYDVIGWTRWPGATGLTSGGRWFNQRPVLNGWDPASDWYGNPPEVVLDISGPEAAALIPKVEAAINAYEGQAGKYRVWPGPNSNTFVATVLRAVPELGTTLPPTAIGKDYRPGLYLGLTDTRTGLEASVWGVLGLKIGWHEGIEANLLSFVAGLDLRRPGLKLPGFGRVGLGGGAALASETASSPRPPAVMPR